LCGETLANNRPALRLRRVSADTDHDTTRLHVTLANREDHFRRARRPLSFGYADHDDFGVLLLGDVCGNS
jgi:hypothetical protein